MSEELGTKDVLEQVNIRLGNMEQDARQFRSEVTGRFDGVTGRFDRVYDEISSLRSEMNQRFMWLYGLMVALVIGIAGLWFK